MVNPLALAVQGLGFGAAQVALQGLLEYVATQVLLADVTGGNAIDTHTRRTRRRVQPAWIYVEPVDEDETLLLAGII